MPRRLIEPPVPDTHIEGWALLWGVPGLGERVSISFSRRMRRSLGRCVPARGVVRLNPWALQGHPTLLDEVLCHELAHVATFELHGPKVRPHGREWAALMRTAGFEPRVRARVSHDVQRVVQSWRAAARALHEHRCPVCQAMRLARRPMRQWRCAACIATGLDGQLVILKRTVRRP